LGFFELTQFEFGTAELRLYIFHKSSHPFAGACVRSTLRPILHEVPIYKIRSHRFAASWTSWSILTRRLYTFETYIFVCGR